MAVHQDPRAARGSVGEDTLGPEPSSAWAGWVAFAGVMLALTGVFDVFQGITALTNDAYFVAGDGDLLVFDFTAWGWVLLAWGLLSIGGGFGLLAARGWARWLGIVLAFLNAVAQIGFLSAYPIWSVIVIALDVFVLFALTARWEEARAALR
jgi:hypothetical protein